MQLSAINYVLSKYENLQINNNLDEFERIVDLLKIDELAKTLSRTSLGGQYNKQNVIDYNFLVNFKELHWPAIKRDLNRRPLFMESDFFNDLEDVLRRFQKMSKVHTSKIATIKDKIDAYVNQFKKKSNSLQSIDDPMRLINDMLKYLATVNKTFPPLNNQYHTIGSQEDLARFFANVVTSTAEFATKWTDFHQNIKKALADQQTMEVSEFDKYFK